MRFPKLLNPVSLFLVGAQKAGTTALFRYLTQHPDIIPGKQKELHFFSSEYKYGKGLGWYHSNFRRRHFLRKKILLDATPSYMANPTAIERIAGYNPNATLVVMLRDPIERAYSAWRMFHNYNELTGNSALVDGRPFTEAIMEELCKEDLYGYLSRGNYLEQIRQIYQSFDISQVLIFEFSELRRNPKFVLDTIVDRLNLGPFQFVQGSNGFLACNYRDCIKKDTLDIMIEYYSKKNQQLFDYLGTSYRWIT